MCDNHGKLAGNPCQEHISLGRGVIADPATSDTHVDFKVVDCPFHNRPDFIEGVPFICIPLDSGKHPEPHIAVGIGGPALPGSAAGILTIADPLALYHVDFRADPFIPVSPPLFMAMPGILHIQGGVFGAGGIAVKVVTDPLKAASIPGVIRDQGPGEMEIVFQEPIGVNGIESGIPKEGIRMEVWVQGKEVRKHGFNEEEPPMDLSSSGESDFFPIGISGCACLKPSSRKAMWRMMPSPLVRMANLSA